MINPLPPPRTYRAKTRLARCRAKEEAKKKIEKKSVSSSKMSSWVPFDSAAPGVSSSWSGDILGEETRESVEVSLYDSFTLTTSDNWISAPINDAMKKLPVIPPPAPSSLSQSRSIRKSHIPQLRQRDTNSEIPSTNSPPRRKFVSRPIESSRGRSKDDSGNESGRSTTSRSRSRSLLRVKGNEGSTNTTIASYSNTKNVGYSDETAAGNIVRPFRRRSRSQTRRERSLSIARKSNTETSINNRSRSLSIAASKSRSSMRAENVIRERRGNSLTRQESRTSKSSEDSENQVMPPLPPRSLQAQIGETNPILGRTGMLNKSIPNTGNNIIGAMNNNLVSLPNPIHTRTLLTSSVYHNEATGIWITTINMNQKSNVTRSNAAKYLKAFSFQTEREARESAYANAPAKLLPFDDNPRCFACHVKFGAFRRSSHCRNCGVVVCSSCTVNWSKQSIPETFNVKNENYVKVCKSCDKLSKLFRQALVEANIEKALMIYNTGNINLRCQFMSVKGSEAMLPIHCAAEGGSLQLLQWLVDVHHCPIKRIRTSNRSKTQTTTDLITTSKGRNILEIAMAEKRVEILNYLVNEKNANFDGIRSLDVALDALHAVLLAYPTRPTIEDIEEQTQYNSPSTYSSGSPATPMTPITPITTLDRDRHTPIRNGIPLYDVNLEDTDDESTDSSSDLYNDNTYGSDDDEESVTTTVHDACIICYENTIDCVITPCGHQICCLNCSKSLNTCPVCNVNCNFIRIFKP